MANTYKIPTPADLLKAVQPRTGPPVANMGGIPTQGMAAQRPNFATLPSSSPVLPGPAPAAQPVTPPAAPVASAATPTAPGTATAPASGPPVFNFNFGGAPTAATPRPGEMWPDAQAPQAPPTTAGGELWPDATAPAPPTTAGGEMWPDATGKTAPTIPDAPYRVARSVPHVPRRFEVESLAPGEGVTTPVGDVFRDAGTGRLKLKLSDAGKVAWRQKEQERLKAFGPYPMSHDPLAPTPDVTPGQPVFNAFEGRWL